MKVVIVDDNQRAANDLRKRLAGLSDVEIKGVANNGFDGLELLLNEHPDVLFLDVELPDISGLDFLDRSAYLKSGHCRVVIYTSYDKYILPALRKRAFDVLLKPIEESDFRSVIMRLRDASGADKQADKPQGVNDTKYLLYTNSVDFTLVDKADIGLFVYDTDNRCWAAVVAGFKMPIKLRRSIKCANLTALDSQFVQVSQKAIINMNYLIEVVDGCCHFFPPFDKIGDVVVARTFRKRLQESFFRL